MQSIECPPETNRSKVVDNVSGDAPKDDESPLLEKDYEDIVSESAMDLHDVNRSVVGENIFDEVVGDSLKEVIHHDAN